jgi:N-methylhydantoinase A
MEETSFRIAVDIGGTFTDGVLEDPDTGRIRVAKTLTTPDDPGQAVGEVIDQLLSSSGTPRVKQALSVVVHGTTLVTNTLIERKGATTALVVTRGTRDVISIGRELRYDLYDLALKLPEPLVPPERRFELDERMSAAGRVRKTLDEDTIDACLDWLGDRAVEAVAVCLLHSYQNDLHERVLSTALKSCFPDLSVSISSQVAREIREYERISTTVANAYVQPLMQRYLTQIENRLEEMGIDAPLRIMLSGGGFTSAEASAAAPILLLESGPAGGVLSAANAGLQTGVNDVVTFDMGGTTAKACLVKDGEPSLAHRFEAARVHRFKRGSGFPMLIPSIDLIEIGAGGGSIASVSPLGLLSVGPESAGAVPGPACYGRGGRSATITDADLLLGYLDPHHFLGGEMPLFVDGAETAVNTIAGALGMDVTRTAWGIHNIVNENMAAAARVHIAEKGYDPRAFTLIATGGAGPVHAVEVARKLKITRILCPIAAGAGSCLGLLAAPARVDRSWSRPARLEAIDWSEVEAIIRQLRRDAEKELQTAGIQKEDAVWHVKAEMRYAGQDDTVNVRFAVRSIEPDLESFLSRGFENRYRELYGRVVPNAAPEVVTWRLTGQTPTRIRRFFRTGHTGRRPALRSSGARPIYLSAEDRFEPVAVYHRDSLSPGRMLQGPLVIEERESTLVVPVPAQVRVLSDLNIMVELNK